MSTQQFVRPTLPEITIDQLNFTQTARAPLAEIEPGDPRLDDPNQCLRPPHQPISPLAVALASHGKLDKAERCDFCGAKREFTCPDNHSQMQYSSCMLRCCNFCADKLRDERLERFYKNLRYMRKRKHYTVLAFHSRRMDSLPSRETLDQFAAEITAELQDSQERDAEGELIPGTGDILRVDVEPTLVGNGRFEFRMAAFVIWWGDNPPVLVAPSSIAAGCTMTQIPRKASDFSNDLHWIHTYNRMPTPELAAQWEVTTERFRRIRVHGSIMKHDPDSLPLEDSVESEGLFASNTEPDMGPGHIANNLPEGCHNSPLTHCKCGKPWCLVTEWMPQGTPPSEVAKARRYPIPQMPT